MDPITILSAANAALALVESLAPSIQAMMTRGEISAEQQSELKGKLDKLRSATAFTGPEWELSTAKS